MSKLKVLSEKGLINPPEFVKHQTQYETIMGSVAYGISSDTSDMDIYGFCIPSKTIIFPHLAGEIEGFDKKKKRFEQYQKHHIFSQDELAGKGRMYDIAIYNITKYFALCMDNNPNMIDSLFTPTNCILHITKIGQMVRENRHLFLHKGCWTKFKGYSYSQMHKMIIKNPIGKRKEIIEKHGYDSKFAYHVVRLLNEVEQILTEEDLDLQRNREQLKSIRRGEWSEEQVKEYFSSKERELETVYSNSRLRAKPNTVVIKNLLISCLEEHFGNLEKCVVQPNQALRALKEIKEVFDKYKIL